MRDFYFTNQYVGWYINQNNIYYTSDGGSSWLNQYSNSYDTLNGIYFVSANEGWVVGNHGVILHTSDSGLPVELIGFSGSVIDGKIHLS